MSDLRVGSKSTWYCIPGLPISFQRPEGSRVSLNCTRGGAMLEVLLYQIWPPNVLYCCCCLHQIWPIFTSEM